MLKIRLQRIGKRGQAYFKVVVTEHTTKPQGKYLELLGSYDPHKNEMHVDAEKVKHWLGQGAKMSETVNNLLVGRSIVEGEKVQVWKPKKKSPPAGGGKTTTASEVKQTNAPSPQVETKENEIKEEKTEKSAVETSKEEPNTKELTPIPAETPAQVNP